MSASSLFKAKCKHCSDEFYIATGSSTECNRCSSVISQIRPLSLIEIGYLLDAAASADRGTFTIVDNRFTKRGEYTSD